MNSENSGLYRQNVGIILVNKHNLLFVAKRNDISTQYWQFPQGGIENGDDEYTSATRELEEETGIMVNSIQLLGKLPHKTRYNFTQAILDDMKKKNKPEWHNIIGQEQVWFFFKFTGEDAEINLNSTNHPEFSEYQWQTTEFALQNCIPFKKDVYTLALEFLKTILPNIVTY